MTNFKCEVDQDGIALITWDMPGRSMNVLNAEVLSELETLLDKTTADSNVKGVVVTTGKDTFSGGADLTVLQKLSSQFEQVRKSQSEEAAARIFFEESRKASVLYRKIETCGKPWACAIRGTAAGGGFELALACHCRVASNDPHTRVGLPEIKVGLFPGAGGTTRIARILPPADALQYLLKGDLLHTDRAQKMKLIDAVVPAADLIKTAKVWIKAGGNAKKPWDMDNFRLPGGPVYSKAGMMTFPAANAIYRRETYDNYPAARAIMQVVYEGLLVPFDHALRIEQRWFAKIVRSPQAAAMTRSLFVSLQELNKGARRPAQVPLSRVKRVGIIGAGFMGAGIGCVTAQAGIDVVLIDQDQDSADRGKAVSDKLMSEQVKRGRATPAERDALLARIAATSDYGALKDCDFVIEAVFERRDVKVHAIRRAQDIIGSNVIFGSNTSTLPITSLAAEFKDPARLIGIHFFSPVEKRIHFFSPVEKMMLVEIILGKHTRDAALATAMDYVRAIKKTPIVVNDSRGFYTSRVVGTYLREGHLMVSEGVPPAMIENVARAAGMPVGPLALTDEVAVDLAWKILQATEVDLGPQAVDPRQKALLEQMVEKRGRNGRKNKKGFYDYPDQGPKRLWSGLAELQAKRLAPNEIDVSELKARLLGIQALETARCFEEQVLIDVREADVGSILGFGFAPFSGGTLSYIDMMGVPAFVEQCRKLEAKYGERFKPAPLLLEMVAKGESFYGCFGPGGQEQAA